MIAVIFEAQPHSNHEQSYRDVAAILRPQLDEYLASYLLNA